MTLTDPVSPEALAFVDTVLLPLGWYGQVVRGGPGQSFGPFDTEEEARSAALAAMRESDAD